MKFKLFLEYQSLLDKSNERIRRDAIKWRNFIDKQKNKEKKEKERLEKKQEKYLSKEKKKSLLYLLQSYKTSVVSNESFKELIPKLREDGVSDKILDLITDFSLDKKASRDKIGTRIVTRNFNVIHRLLSNPLVKDNENPRVVNVVARIYRLCNPSLNNKSDLKIQDYYKSVNNLLFNSAKDLIFELIREELLDAREN